MLTIDQYSVRFSNEFEAQSHFDTNLDACPDVSLNAPGQEILTSDCGFETRVARDVFDSLNDLESF
jgi:hypothetical protein